MSVRDVTFHPCAAAAAVEWLAAALGDRPPPVGNDPVRVRWCREARERYQEVLQGGEADGELSSALARALGASLADVHPYWYERASGLRSLAGAAGVVITGVVRDPSVLLADAVPRVASRGPLPEAGGVWVPAEAVVLLRSLLQRHGDALRTELEGRGEYTYFAALVEAIGYCLEHGLGLLELEGVCSLAEAPSPRLRRAFFDRIDTDLPDSWADPGDAPAAPAAPLEQAEAALADGDLERALAAVDAALGDDPDDSDIRLLRDRICAEAGRDLEGVVARLKVRLRDVLGDLDVDDLSWLDDPDLVSELADPDWTAALLGVLGTAYLQMGFPVQGEFVLERALDLAPDDATLRARLEALS